MDIKLFEKFTKEKFYSLYDLSDPVLQLATNIQISEYIVQEEDFMRPDLIMKSIYGTDDFSDIDIILYLNDIDNPLSILPGDVLIYPVNTTDFDNFRYTVRPEEVSDTNVKKELVIPNKTTRKDSGRKDFLESGYSLPPVVLDKPKEPVRIEGNNILIGGL